jgi:hypothetical protein
VVSLEESLVEVSLCVQEGLPQLQNLNYTEMLVVLQIPKAGAPFQGVRACFVPTSVSQFRFPSITTKLWVETIWYCPLSFRKLDDEGGFDGTDIEALIVPHEREVREVFICCGKCSTKCHVVELFLTSFSLAILGNTPDPRGKRRGGHEILALVRYLGRTFRYLRHGDSHSTL